jgi:hypothetical protein
MWGRSASFAYDEAKKLLYHDDQSIVINAIDVMREIGIRSLPASKAIFAHALFSKGLLRDAARRYAASILAELFMGIHVFHCW